MYGQNDLGHYGKHLSILSSDVPTAGASMELV